jgi:hypothetical protein
MNSSELSEIIKLEIPRMINTIKRNGIVVVNQTATQVLLLRAISATISLLEAFKEKRIQTGIDIEPEEFMETMSSTFVEFSYLLMIVNNYDVKIEAFDAIKNHNFQTISEFLVEDYNKMTLCAKMQEFVSSEMFNISNVAYGM